VAVSRSGGGPLPIFAILIGVVGGYFIGVYMERAPGWEYARYVTMPMGGLATGILGRLWMGDPPRGPR
jgi:hypothetical protein